MMNFIRQAWKAYIDWCDRMGLGPESQRCCAPKLSDDYGPVCRKISESELDQPHVVNSATSSAESKQPN